MGIPGWTVTAHARDRMHEMRVKERELRAVLEGPELEYRSTDDYPYCRVRVAGRLAVPYDPHTRTVITVLWRDADGRGEPA